MQEVEMQGPKWPFKETQIVEIARWWYEPSSTRNGGDWIYELHMVPDRDTWKGKIVIEFRLYRERFDAIRKKRIGNLQWVECWRSGFVLKDKAEFERVFLQSVERAKERAEQDRVRYERILARLYGE